MNPRVSVCVPAYQSGEHLQETLDSVWRQDFEDFELVVVDDGSTDATAEILAAQADRRLRFHRHESNRGQVVTVGETIARARGELIKFLDSDDLLRADCLGVMVAAINAHPEAAFAFSRREILAERPDDPWTQGWIEDLRDLHRNFHRLGEVNDGAELIRQYLDALFPSNWIAEPAGVMARRADLIAVGGYNRRLRQNNDVDLWLRLMTRGAVIFIDKPLYTYRLAHSGVTGSSAAGRSQWLDPLWTAEGLMELDDFPEPDALRTARRRLLARAVRRVLRAPLREPRWAPTRVADLAVYGHHRLATSLGRAEPLHLPIPAGAAID